MSKPHVKHSRSFSSFPAPEITPRRMKVKSCFPENPTYTGYMHIRSSNVADFSRRYFCLKHNFLLSAKSPRSRKLERVIPLEGTNVPSETRTSTRSFEVITNKKVYSFRCSTPEKCETWVQLLEKASSMCLEDIYEIGRTLGASESHDTKVVEGRHRVSGDRVAIKIIDKDKYDRKHLQTEVNVLKRIKHECVVQLYDIFETSTYLHLVMELCEGGELFEQIISLGEGRHYDEAWCCNIIHQIARGLKFMHSHGIVHRDLKPENILCVDSSASGVKIADFGISKVLRGEQTKMRTISGTLMYLAPEVLKGLPWDERVDHWSLGVIMHLLLTGNPPFYAENASQLTRKIIWNEVCFDTEEWDYVSKPAKDLVRILLSKDPRNRGTLDDVLKLTWKEKTNKESFRIIKKNLRRHVVKGKLRRMSCDVQSSTSSMPRISRTRWYRSFGEHKNYGTDFKLQLEQNRERRSSTPEGEHSRSHQRYVSQDSGNYEEPLKMDVDVLPKKTNNQVRTCKVFRAPKSTVGDSGLRGSNARHSFRCQLNDDTLFQRLKDENLQSRNSNELPLRVKDGVTLVALGDSKFDVSEDESKKVEHKYNKSCRDEFSPCKPQRSLSDGIIAKQLLDKHSRRNNFRKKNRKTSRKPRIATMINILKYNMIK